MRQTHNHMVKGVGKSGLWKSALPSISETILASFLFCSMILALGNRPPMTQPTAQSVLRNPGPPWRRNCAVYCRKMEGFGTARSIPLRPCRHRPPSAPRWELSCGALHEGSYRRQGPCRRLLDSWRHCWGVFLLLPRLFLPSRTRVSSSSANIQQIEVGNIRLRLGRGQGWGSGGFTLRRLAHPSMGVPNLPPPHPTLPRQGGREKILLVLPAYGLRDYGHCLVMDSTRWGLSPHRLILAETAHRKDTLWAMEEALHSRAVAAVAGFIDQIDLEKPVNGCNSPPPIADCRSFYCGRPSFWKRARRRRAGASKRRLAARDRFGLITRARWRLSLERCRNGRTGEWMVEYDHVAHRFSLVAALADPAISSQHKRNRRARTIPPPRQLIRTEPFVLAVTGSGGPRIAALNEAAEAAGLALGETLADARAKTGRVQTRAVDTTADDTALRRLAPPGDALHRRPPRLGARRTAPTACSSISKARRICSAAKKNCSPICPSGLRRISACRRGLRLPTPPPAWPGRWRVFARAPLLPSSPALREEDDHAQHGGGGKYECAEQTAPPPHFVWSSCLLRYATRGRIICDPAVRPGSAGAGAACHRSPAVFARHLPDVAPARFPNRGRAPRLAARAVCRAFSGRVAAADRPGARPPRRAAEADRGAAGLSHPALSA